MKFTNHLLTDTKQNLKSVSQNAADILNQPSSSAKVSDQNYKKAQTGSDILLIAFSFTHCNST